MSSDEFLEWVMAVALAAIVVMGIVALVGAVAIELMGAMP